MGERLNDLNTRQVEDARTSLVSTPPYAYAVVQGEDGKENVSLQFDHPEMCGQKYKQAIPLFTTPQTKPLTDEELNKAFDYYCETDEGVLRFNYELRDEWKKEQLIRWKEAFKKASEK